MTILLPQRFFGAFTKAIIKVRGFRASHVPGTMFLPWVFDGMHDAAPYNRTVVRRTNFERTAGVKGETVQLDLLEYANGRRQAAVFIRIHEAPKGKNTANATLKSDRLTDDGKHFVEFAGKTNRRKRIETVLSTQRKLKVRGNKIIISSTLSPIFVDRLVSAARLIAHAEPSPI